MKRKTAGVIIAAMLSTSLVFPHIDSAAANQQNITASGYELKEKTAVSERMQPWFSWDHPGPVSPVLFPGTAWGAGLAEQPLNDINPMIEELIKEKAMPGAVVFVAKQGQIVKHEAFGYAYKYKDDQFTEAENPLKMKKDTIFDVASISKIFTTVAAMKLYEQGKFKLDDAVAVHIPEFAQNGKETVTIRQLMTHTSGMAASIPLHTQGTNREDRLQIVLQQPLEASPGTKYTYSDLNMIALGVLVERLSGKRLDEFVKQKITQPLGMKDTMYNPPAKLKNRIAATEYQPLIGRGLVWGQVHDEKAWALDGVAGHAGVFSTAGDLAKLAHMFINDGRYGAKRILKRETIKLLEENQIPEFPGDDHGLGWELNQGWYMDALSDGTSLGHTGYTGTSLVINKNNAAIAILLTNRVHPSRETVSANIARRQFARLTADAIPVAILGRMPAWFSGYGDQLDDRILTAAVDVKLGAKMTFQTWYRTEVGNDYGYIEASSDGKVWSAVTDPINGSSGNWIKFEADIPQGTKYIRFRYDTDDIVNGRGWYIGQVKLKLANGKEITPFLTGAGWEKRRH